MIKFHSLKRIFKFGFVSFWRHWWLSLTSILFMAITLIIISLFVILNFAIQSSTASLKDKMDMTITFKPVATTDQILALKHDLSNRNDVKSVEYIDKQMALERWQQLKIKDSVKSLVTADNNILPESLEVNAVDPANLDDINQFVMGKTYSSLIENTSYQKNKDTVQTFLNAAKVVKEVGAVVSAVFFLIAIMIILNTIRMAIVTRKDEIEIMRLVGASNHFITIPFIIEAILYGVIGCALSVIFISTGSVWLAHVLSSSLAVDFNVDAAVLDHLLAIALLQLLVGVAIGVFSALISIRSFLKT